VGDHYTDAFKGVDRWNFTTFGLFDVLKDAYDAFLKDVLYNIKFLALPGRDMKGVDPTLDERSQ